MVTFGQALKSLRGRRKAADVARVAVGNGSAEQQRDFANYLSRIERDKVPNVGLPQLRLIAKGLEFPSLGPFFSALDAIEAKAGGAIESEAHTDDVSEFAEILMHPTHDHHSLSASAADRALLTRLAVAIVNVVDAAESRGQDATARRKSAARPKNSRANRR